MAEDIAKEEWKAEEFLEQNKPLVDLAKELGLSYDSLSDAKTKEDAEAAKSNLLKTIRETEISDPEQKKHRDDFLKTLPKETLVVGGEDEKSVTDEWIARKRAFWKEYAEANALTMQNEPEKDVSTFTANFVKGTEQKGTVLYTSERNVSISQNSDLSIYKGVALDAVKSGYSLTFGETLQASQKLMLYAAALDLKETYKDGSKIELVNPPAIDVNSEVFKKLPQDVQDILKTELQRQQNEKKLAEVKLKLKANAEKIPTTDAEKKQSVEERYALRKEQIAAMRGLLSPEETKQRQEKDQRIIDARARRAKEKGGR